MNGSNPDDPNKPKSTEDSDRAENDSLHSEKKARGSEKTSYVRIVFTPCIRLVTGWSVYMRQQVLLAGLALACVYMTVLGFDSITMGGYLSLFNISYYFILKLGF